MDLIENGRISAQNYRRATKGKSVKPKYGYLDKFKGMAMWDNRYFELEKCMLKFYKDDADGKRV